MSELVEANLKFHGSRSSAYALLNIRTVPTVYEWGNMFHFVAQSQKVGIAKADGFWSYGAEGPAFAVALARQLHSPLDLHPFHKKSGHGIGVPVSNGAAAALSRDSGFFVSDCCAHGFA